MKLWKFSSCFCITITLCFCAPTKRTKGEEKTKTKVETKSLSAGSMSSETDCYFHEPKTSALEKSNTRPEKSQVSTECSGVMMKMNELLEWPVNPELEATNSIALLVCRGAGQCDLDFSKKDVLREWSTRSICEHHADELLRKWDSSNPNWYSKHVYRKNNKAVCSMADGIGLSHTNRPEQRLSPLTVRGSDAILKQKGILVHPGVPICRDHKKEVENLISQLSSHPQKRRKSSNVKHDLDDEPNTEMCSSDPDFTNRETPKLTALQSSFIDFAKAAGVDRCFPRTPFSSLREDTQRKKTCSIRKLVNTVFRVAAPEYADELAKMVYGNRDEESWTTGSSENLHRLMEEIAVQYAAAEDDNNKMIVLSIVSNSFPIATCQKYIPNLRSHIYYKARRFARRDRKEVPKTTTLERYDRIRVQKFIEFITSPTVMIGLPWGTRKVKMSDGTSIEIANTIRQQSATEIIGMYEQLLKETNEESYLLSRSTMYRVLNACSATERTASTCVDYFVADGMEAFEGLHGIVDTWTLEGLLDKEESKRWKTELYESAQYLRTDYRLHVKDKSRVADHCATWALSDPNENQFSTSCKHGESAHSHDLRCDRCEQVKVILRKIEEMSEENIKDANVQLADATIDSLANLKSVFDRRDEERQLIEKYKKMIQEMKKHLLRAVYTSEERSEIIGTLKDKEALITMDFAQKYLPKWHRETQNNYFGKKGINYHISHVTAKVGDALVQHSFVHIYSEEISQDSSVVVLTLAHDAEELKKVGIEKISIRSDNAGAYHCAATIGALHWIMEEKKIEIGSWTFSEAQNGKSSSDRDANRVKRKAESYVAKGNDITTPDQFFKAMADGQILNGVSTHHGNIISEVKGAAKWPKISTLNHFTVEKDGIRGRKYGKIGSGEFIRKDDLKSTTGTYAFSEAGFKSSSIVSVEQERKAVADKTETKFWYFSTRKEVPRVPEPVNENEDIEDEHHHKHDHNGVSSLFTCPVVGCGASFLSSWKLDEHVLRDKHRISPDKLTMRDMALQQFQKKIEEVDQFRTFGAVASAIEKLSEKSENSELGQGWALKEKQTRRPFEEDVKRFLIECFEEGLRKKRLDPKTVAKRMEVARKADGSLRFKVEERKDFQQIAGFFSREAKNRRMQENRSKREAIEDEYSVPEDEHDDAGWIRFLKDEATWTTSDEFFEAVMSDEDPVFIFDELNNM